MEIDIIKEVEEVIIETCNEGFNDCLADINDLVEIGCSQEELAYWVKEANSWLKFLTGDNKQAYEYMKLRMIITPQNKVFIFNGQELNVEPE